jgi:hypothetical protein
MRKTDKSGGANCLCFLAISALLLLVIPEKALSASQDSDLIGQWRHTEEFAICNMTYKENGTFTGNLCLNDRIVWEYEGKWSVSDNIVTYHYTHSSSERFPDWNSR